MSPNKVSETLLKLVDLQNVDSQLKELEELQGNLPTRVEDLSNEVDTLQISMDNNSNRLKEIELGIRKFEGIINDNKTKLDKLQNQLYVVKTNREYDALMTEIDVLKAEIDQAEIQELELSEEKDHLEEQSKVDTLKLEEVSKELKIQKEKLDKTITNTEKEQKAFMSQRDAILLNIEARYISLYNRISRARNGVAVVSVRTGACGGCHAKLTSQTLAEIMGGTIIHTCPACRRFLYLKTD